MNVTQNSAKTELLGLPRESLGAFFTAAGERPFRAAQLMKWLYHRGVTEFEAMTDLSRAVRAMLAQSATVELPRVVGDQYAADGTRKWLLQLHDGNVIETVFIPESGRGTLCISSQVGCALTCTFCATARQGFSRNLGAAEVVAQLMVADRALRESGGGRSAITNVVLMGMGEPLLNFGNVVAAMRIMLDDHGYGLSKRRVTLSTSGLVPAMDRLADTLDVSLAVSLHAPNNALRDHLVPLNRKYPIEELLAACRRYLRHKHRRETVTFEYVMLEGVNDSEAHARELITLLRDLPAKVNLIPFNPFTGARYRRSSTETILRFGAQLQGAGIVTVTRRPRGEDIDAACGQLVGKVADRSRRARYFARQEEKPAA